MILPGSLWFLNIILFLMHIFFAIFLFFNQTIIKNNFNIKNRFDVEAVSFSPQLVLGSLQAITESRDLFNTAMPTPEKNKKVSYFVPSNYIQITYPPVLPMDLPVESNVFQEQALLPPLQLDLHGTIISSNPMKNRAFLENTRSKEEKEYFVGDIVDDAQIIYIGRDKVTFVRSNGQEEVIYLHQVFKIDYDGKAVTDFEKIIQKKENGLIIINKNLFKHRIKSLSFFIDQLGLVTYFQNNLPIGCLIQNAREGSLGYYLGFMPGDIVIDIDGIPTNTIESRMAIFEYIDKKNNNKSESYNLSVSCLRNNQMSTILYEVDLSEEATKKKMGTINVNTINMK